MADHKEYWSTESDQGSIRISEDVVASIAALAASETDGVSGLYSSVTRDIVSFLSKKNLSKGVRVELGEEDTVKVEISFLALFGHNICEVAKQVHENVKSRSRRTFFYARYAGRGNVMGSSAQGKTAALCGNFALLCNYAVLPLRFSVK